MLMSNYRNQKQHLLPFINIQHVRLLESCWYTLSEHALNQSKAVKL